MKSLFSWTDWMDFSYVTEDEEISNHLHSMGREFGATTGRPRRCGWADGVLLRFSAMFRCV